jgi:hypothetical protein
MPTVPTQLPLPTPNPSRILIPYLVGLGRIAALCGLLLPSAWATSETGPNLPTKHEIPGAINIAITPSGQKYFETQFGQILKNLGVNLSEGYFSQQTIVAAKPINLDDLEKKYPEPIKVVKEVRTLLTQWLMGFTLKDHRPAFQIGASEYAAEISRMAVITDQELMDQLHRRDGAVLVIELEVKKIEASSDHLKVWDVQNRQLGELGLQGVKVTMGGQQTPLFIRLPVYVMLNAQDELRFEVLSFEQNLDRTPIEIKYEHLIIPQLMVELNGYKYPLNNSKLESYLEAQIPNLLTKAREYIKDYAKNDLPAKLNDLAEKNLKGQFEEIQQLPAAGRPTAKPGQPEDPKDANYLWGMKLKKLHLQNNMYIGFNAYIEDPLNRNNPPLAPVLNSRGAPELAKELTPHDLVLSIDRGVLNRVLQLSFMRGYFNDLSQGGTALKLRDVPAIDYTPTPAGEVLKAKETFIKLHIKAETEPHNIALTKTIVIDFDLIAKLAPATATQEMEIVLHSIDLNSVQMDKNYMSWIGRLVPGKVMAGIRDRLEQTAAPWKTTRVALDGKMDLPPPILGQKLDLQKLSFDPNGHLVMYLNFKLPSGTHHVAAERAK